MKSLIAIVCVCVLLAACQGAATPTPTRSNDFSRSPTPTETSSNDFSRSPTPTETGSNDFSRSYTPTSTPDSRLLPAQWKDWPVVPGQVSATVKVIYQQGLELGNNPHAFSKIGDCESTPTWFMGAFDGKPGDYSLGPYTNLQAVITAFHGSFGRTSLAAGRGFSSANTLASLWADRKLCQKNETPLACEIRLNRPAFALVMLGTNDVYHQDTFVTNMRTILDVMIQQGVVPILATKADNLEGDEAINAAIVRLAYDYDLPLWNFWKAVQPLPDHGLQSDGSHLTWAGPYFDDPIRMKSAWPWRNLTGLQALDAVWRGVGGQ